MYKSIENFFNYFSASNELKANTCKKTKTPSQNENVFLFYYNLKTTFLVDFLDKNS